MKTLLVLTTTYPRWQGDTEPAFVHYLNKQLASDFRVIVLAPHTPGARRREMLEGIDVRRFRYLPVPLQKLAYDGGIVPKLKRNRWLALQIPFLFLSMFVSGYLICKKEKVDIIHAHWLLPQGFIAVRLAVLLRSFSAREIKTVCTSHGADLFSLNAPLFTSLKKQVIRHIDALSVVSQSMKQYCEREFMPEKPIHVLSMGIDLQGQFINSTPQSERSGIIYVGRLVEKKGVMTLLQAFSSLSKKNPGQTLTIVGEGTEKQKLLEYVNQEGLDDVVTFSGSVTTSEVARYLNQHKICVMPSQVASDGDQEGLGLVAAEAIACGCITIVSDLPAIRDVHNVPELQFRAGDADDLYRLLDEVIKNEAMALERSASLQKHVNCHFDWQVVGDRYKQLIQGM